MFNSIIFKTRLAVLISAGIMSVSLANCGVSTDTKTSKNKPSENTKSADTAEPNSVDNNQTRKDAQSDRLIPDQKSMQEEALKNPDWVKVDTLPPEWSGLYEKDCDIGGPEKSSFFSYRNHKTNTVYYFSYFIYPPSLNKAPDADIVPVLGQVWQNRHWPDHYLIYSAESFTQILIKDGWSRGMHQTLDGAVWDSNKNWSTRYKDTDAVRWAVDLSNTKDYGSHPACNLKLATPWTGQSFKTKAGKSYTLDELIGTQ